MQFIESNKGNLYLIDDIDSDLLQYDWSENCDSYLQRFVDNESVFLHIVIAKRMNIYIVGLEIDHKDRDVTNNQRNNLRVATRSENLHNGKKYSYDRKTSSTHRGVYFHKLMNKWCARINVNGIRFNLGFFDTQEKAALEYNRQAKYYFGEFAVLNNVIEDNTK